MKPQKIKMFTKEKTIKKGIFTTVEKGSFKGIPAVKKQYIPEQVQRYLSESKNLGIISDIQLPNSVNAIFRDNLTRTLIYPYIEGENGDAALLSPDKEGNLVKIFKSMADEISYLSDFITTPFKFIPEGHKMENDAFSYCKLLSQKGNLSKKQVSELKKLSQIDLNIGWGRYDPEFSNVIFSPEGVKHIDYESMSLQDNLFAFAYSLIHSNLKEKPLIDQSRFLELAKPVATSKLCKESEFYDKIRLNLAEVAGYLLFEFDRKNNENIGKIEKLEKLLKEIL